MLACRHAGGQPGDAADGQTRAAERQDLTSVHSPPALSVCVREGGGGGNVLDQVLSLCLHTQTNAQTHTCMHTHTVGLPCLSLASAVTRRPSAVITQHTTVIVDFTALGAPHHGI